MTSLDYKVTGSEEMLALIFTISLSRRQIERLRRSALRHMLDGHYLRWMSARKCVNNLVQFLTGRCRSFYFSVS